MCIRDSPKDIIASCIGKAKDTGKLPVNDRDLVKSLIIMLCMNVGQLSYFYSELEKTPTVLMVTNKVHNIYFNYILNSFLDFWSKGTRKILFVEDSPYFVAKGAALHAQGAAQN
eukprot:TRINITY_DN5811_c0_g1_i5.p1 TRINITY_DN5811_c0_g1~~TRINITY_DN5811_c0_g1_i5.p1  ORF type:complete len:133 (+),score=43.22 TRINITY_DN5811_c0_g1_i5:60-401(+)